MSLLPLINWNYLINKKLPSSTLWYLEVQLIWKMQDWFFPFIDHEHGILELIYFLASSRGDQWTILSIIVNLCPFKNVFDEFQYIRVTLPFEFKSIHICPLDWLLGSLKHDSRHFPGCSVVGTPKFLCRGHEFDPLSGNYDPTCHMTWPKIF